MIIDLEASFFIMSVIDPFIEQVVAVPYKCDQTLHKSLYF